MKKKFYDMGGVIVSYILNIIIIAYTLLYVISPVNKWHVLTDQFKYAEYDAIVYDCTQIYLEDILLKNTEIDSYLIRGMSLFEHTVKFGETAITV